MLSNKTLRTETLMTVNGANLSAADLGDAAAEIQRLKKELEDKEWIISRTDAGLKILYRELQNTTASLETKVRERTQDLEGLNKVLGQDLAERKRAEEEIRKSEASFRNVITRNVDGIIVVDKNGLVGFVNPAAEVLFGRKAEELLGESFGFPVVVGELVELGIIRPGGKMAIAEMRATEID